MVRLFLIIFIVSSCFANNIDNIVEGLVGKNTYNSQKTRFKSMFSNESRFYNKVGEPNLSEIVRTLKINGLFKMSFDNPKSINLTYKTNGDALVFIKVISSTLESMGYSFYLSKSMKVIDDKINWTITLSTQYLPDPALFDEYLRKNGCKIDSIEKIDENNWEYVININQAKIQAESFELNRQVITTKPLKPYIIDVSNASKIEIRANMGDNWFAKIAFLDKNLRLIENIDSDEQKTSMQLVVPELAQYLIVSDKYTLDNIKRGLVFFIHSR